MMTPLTRPKMRAECAAVPRPCPFATCRYNLTVDVNARGHVRELPIVDGAPSCALDVADSGEVPTHAELGAWLDLTPGFVVEVESAARDTFLMRGRRTALADYLKGRW